LLDIKIDRVFDQAELDAAAARYGGEHGRTAAAPNSRIPLDRRALRISDQSIRLQQRADARANDGHITRAEQRTLNQELNANSNAIGK
jgi:hypothetical protein